MLNDLRPVALTATIMKVFDRVVLSQLKILATDFLDLWHFTYRRERGWKMLFCISWATSIIIWTNLIASLVSCSLISLAPLIQFSRSYLQKKLSGMKASIKPILWVLDYLTNWSQFVKFSSALSDAVLTNTGAPQGTMLWPFLFSLYTAYCRRYFS